MAKASLSAIVARGGSGMATVGPSEVIRDSRSESRTGLTEAKPMGQKNDLDIIRDLNIIDVMDRPVH